jgi:CBS-domain-containing membrane protein
MRGPADGREAGDGDHWNMRRDPGSVSVGNVMHRGVVCCDRETPAAKVAMMMMTAHRIHAVVVTGIADLPRLVTDAEIASALFSDTLETARADDISISAPLLRVSDSVDEALARIHERGSTHAITVDRAFRPVGVVSVLDLIEARQRKEAE